MNMVMPYLPMLSIRKVQKKIWPQTIHIKEKKKKKMVICVINRR